MADATYFYDGEGKRVKKISSTETVIFVYNAGGNLVAEYSTALAETQQVSYLTQDHLGSARVVTDQNGAVTNRSDYAAFGEETFTSQRTSGLKYETTPTADDLRKGYTGYEKDDESGLDFAQARYYNSTHGRFTSVDPLTASANVKNPQTFNRYSYVLNSPYKFVDPLGLISSSTGACGNGCPGSDGFSGGYSSSYDSGRRPGRWGTAIEIANRIREEFDNWQRAVSRYERQQAAAGSDGNANNSGDVTVRQAYLKYKGQTVAVGNIGEDGNVTFYMGDSSLDQTALEGLFGGSDMFTVSLVVDLPLDAVELTPMDPATDIPLDTSFSFARPSGQSNEANSP